MHPTEIAMMGLVADRPADDGPRLVLADFLEEAGDGDWAQLVRLQCRVAARPAVKSGRPTPPEWAAEDAEERRLLNLTPHVRHFAPLPGCRCLDDHAVDRWAWVRGLPDRLQYDLDYLEWAYASFPADRQPAWVTETAGDVVRRTARALGAREAVLTYGLNSRQQTSSEWWPRGQDWNFGGLAGLTVWPRGEGTRRTCYDAPTERWARGDLGLAVRQARGSLRAVAVHEPLPAAEYYDLWRDLEAARLYAPLAAPWGMLLLSAALPPWATGEAAVPWEQVEDVPHPSRDHVTIRCGRCAERTLWHAGRLRTPEGPPWDAASRSTLVHLEMVRFVVPNRASGPVTTYTDCVVFLGVCTSCRHGYWTVPDRLPAEESP